MNLKIREDTQFWYHRLHNYLNYHFQYSIIYNIYIFTKYFNSDQAIYILGIPRQIFLYIFFFLLMRILTIYYNILTIMNMSLIIRYMNW